MWSTLDANKLNLRYSMKAKKNKLVWYPFHHKPGLTTIYEKETGWWILFDHFGLLIVIKKIIKVLNDSFKKKKKD